MSDLIKRLRGKYSFGPEGIKEDRDFGSYTPRICVEAAERIEELEAQLDRAVVAIKDNISNCGHGGGEVAGLEWALNIIEDVRDK